MTSNHDIGAATVGGGEPASNAAHDTPLYVINLCASAVPLPLEMPDVDGPDGLVIFRSQRIEDGRKRFRLHLGYFESAAAAGALLPALQLRYPTAWIAIAPRAGLGSLDDTGATEFRLLRAPVAKLPPTLRPVQKPARILDAELGTDLPPLPAAPITQRYVIQLEWTRERIRPAQLPPIAIFDAYTLYTVTCARGGVRFYGTRLGFFTSLVSVRQVAAYLRSDFPSVAVLPISDREFKYALRMDQLLHR